MALVFKWRFPVVAQRGGIDVLERATDLNNLAHRNRKRTAGADIHNLTESLCDGVMGRDSRIDFSNACKNDRTPENFLNPPNLKSHSD